MSDRLKEIEARVEHFDGLSVYDADSFDGTIVDYDAFAAFDDRDWLLALVKTQNAQITRMQAQSTHDLDVARGLRVLDRTPGLDRVIKEVVAERYRQDNRWGAIETMLHVEDGCGTPDAVAYEVIAKAECDAAFAEGSGTFAHLVGEEYAEVLGARSPEAIRVELVQLAALCLKWMQIQDLRGAK